MSTYCCDVAADGGECCCITEAVTKAFKELKDCAHEHHTLVSVHARKWKAFVAEMERLDL